MMSAGQLLQSERLKRNRSVADISTQTCISGRYIDALERDDLKQLPGDFFYKAFLRQYAKALDLDAATTDRILAAAVPTEDTDPVPVLSEVYAKASEPTSSRWAPPTAVAVAALVLVLAGGAGLIALWQRMQSQKEAAAEQAQVTPPAVGTQQPQSTPAPQPSTPAAIAEPNAQQSAATVTPAPTPADPSSQSATTSAVPPAQAPAPAQASAGSIALELVASEPTWVQLSSGGKILYIGTLKPSEPRQFAVAENAKLLTGNAGALDVRLNGRPVGSLGPKGQVRTVFFSNDSFQIAPPKPKPAPSGESTTAPTNTASALPGLSSQRADR